MPEKSYLDNGVRVLTERIDHVRSVSLGIWVEVGSRDEAWKQAGMSHMIEHMIFKGTENLSAQEIALELDSIGGVSNAFTSREQTCFHAKVLDEQLSRIVDLLTDIFLNSTFDPKELARERSVVLQEIKMVEDTPDEYVHTNLPDVLWSSSSLGRPILGREETVAYMSQEKLKAYQDQSYGPDKIIISACGSLEHEQVIDLVRKSFGSLEKKATPKKRSQAGYTPGDRLLNRKLEQTHVSLGFPAIATVDPNRYPCALLNVILGGSMSSRLFQEVREKRGLAYAVYSYMAAYSDAGYMGVYMGVEPGTTREAMKVVMEVLTEMAENGVTDEELEKAKNNLKAQILLSAESTDSRMNQMARNEYTFGKFISYDEIARNIEKVAIEDVAAMAEKILIPKEMVLVGLGPNVEKVFGSGWYRNCK